MYQKKMQSLYFIIGAIIQYSKITKGPVFTGHSVEYILLSECCLVFIASSLQLMIEFILPCKKIQGVVKASRLLLSLFGLAFYHFFDP